MSNPTACLIIIGNEILSGRTVDANLSHLATALNELGIRMAEARVIPDIEEEIIDAVTTCRAKHTYVFTTGGIGPTHDDITADAIAKAFGVPLERNPEAWRRLVAFYPPEKLNEARAKMADMPVGVELIDNPVSAAPGFIIANVHVLPGVPKIMHAMLDGLTPRLVGGDRIVARTVVCTSGEGDLAAALRAIQAAHPDLDVGSYPFMRMGSPGTSVVFRGTDRASIDAAVEELLAHARAADIKTDLEVMA